MKNLLEINVIAVILLAKDAADPIVINVLRVLLGNISVLTSATLAIQLVHLAMDRLKLPAMNVVLAIICSQNQLTHNV